MAKATEQNASKKFGLSWQVLHSVKPVKITLDGVEHEVSESTAAILKKKGLIK